MPAQAMPRAKAAKCVVALNRGMRSRATVTARNTMTGVVLHHLEASGGVRSPITA